MIIIEFTVVVIIAICFILWAIGKISFSRMVEQENAMLFSSETTNNSRITLKDLEHLPELLKNHLIHSHVIGTKRAFNLTNKQKGEIKVDRNKDWMPFTATQYFSSSYPGFV